MLLITVATDNEIKPLEKFLAATEGVEALVTGMGPVATAACLSSYLTRHGSKVHGVLNIGVAGAYLDSGLEVLDICLAQQESLGDFGICTQDGIQDFTPGLTPAGSTILLNNKLVSRIATILLNKKIAYKTVNFVTVNCCTGTNERGDFLQKKFSAGCENMEGAAMAMVCKNQNVDCVELRCVSNMVQDRNTGTWNLTEAIAKICRTTEIVLHGYSENRL